MKLPIQILSACTVAAITVPQALAALYSPEELQAKINQFAPVRIGASVSQFSPDDQEAIKKLVSAAQIMDTLFLRQVWSGNEAMLRALELDQTKGSKERLELFRLNKGPWSRHDQNESFISSAPSVKPAAANFYPEDMTKEEFETWLTTLTPEQTEQAKSDFTTIRRDAKGQLQSVPYSQEYREFLEPAAQLLREAAALTSFPSLKEYLLKRAEAFITNDYFPSDKAWIDLSSPVHVTIGPYENYEDELFNNKAAFEAYVGVIDQDASSKLDKFRSYFQEFEDHLPIADEYKNPRMQPGSPIDVVNVIFNSGDANRGVQTAAFNLPNHRRFGTKQILLKNVQEAKFDKVLMPIARIVMKPALVKEVTFDSFFTHILAHELSHTLGPSNIKVDGRETTARQELKNFYSTIEEAKADITGLFILQYLMNKGELDASRESEMYSTYFAGIFRSVRFGINEAHGRGMALQFNYLAERGGIVYDAGSGQFNLDLTKLKVGVVELAHDLLTLEAQGNYAGAKAMIETYGVISPVLQKQLERMTGVPVDIRPIHGEVLRSSL